MALCFIRTDKTILLDIIGIEAIKETLQIKAERRVGLPLSILFLVAKLI